MNLMNEEKLNPYKLNREEFASALRKGQGRAMLHVMHYGLEDVNDLVLEACLHNQVFDNQIDSNRGGWLFEMFQGSPHFIEFRDAIINAIETETNDWNQYQLCRLVMEIASQDDNEALRKLRAFVYENAADPASQMDWLGIEELISLDGTQGIIELARIFGNRLLSDPNDFVSDYFLHQESFPEYSKVLNAYSQGDESINRYREYLEKRGQGYSSKQPVDKETIKRQNYEKARKEYSLQMIMDLAKKKGGKSYIYTRFGKYATEEELEVVYTALLEEPRDSIRKRLLWVFRRAKLPRIDKKLLAWANRKDKNIRSSAIQALAQLTDPRIRQLARRKLESGKLPDPADEVIDLFVNNFETGDEILIESFLDQIRLDPYEIHGVGFSLLELANRQENLILASLILWVYENTPCAYCRYKAAVWLDRVHQLPDAVRFECQYDSDEDTRAFARGNGEN
jgi:hypothetical protein